MEKRKKRRRRNRQHRSRRKLAPQQTKFLEALEAQRNRHALAMGDEANSPSAEPALPGFRWDAERQRFFACPSVADSRAAAPQQPVLKKRSLIWLLRERQTFGSPAVSQGKVNKAAVVSLRCRLYQPLPLALHGDETPSVALDNHASLMAVAGRREIRVFDPRRGALSRVLHSCEDGRRGPTLPCALLRTNGVSAMQWSPLPPRCQREERGRIRMLAAIIRRPDRPEHPSSLRVARFELGTADGPAPAPKLIGGQSIALSRHVTLWSASFSSWQGGQSGISLSTGVSAGRCGRVFRCETGRGGGFAEVAKLPRLPSDVFSQSFTGISQRVIICGCRSGAVCEADTRLAGIAKSWKCTTRNGTNSVCWIRPLEDDNHVLIASTHGCPGAGLRLCDRRVGGRVVFEYDASHGHSGCLHWATPTVDDDEDFVAIGGCDGLMRVWSVSTGLLCVSNKLEGHHDGDCNILGSCNNRIVGHFDPDKVLSAWSVASGAHHGTTISAWSTA